MERYETNVVSVCLFMYGYGLKWEGGCIYTMPCTLVTLDFQIARPFLLEDSAKKKRMGKYCTVPFFSCVKPWPLSADREMYPSVFFLLPLKEQLIFGASAFAKRCVTRMDTF